MRIRSRLFASALLAIAPNRVVYGRSELFASDWLTLLGDEVRLYGGRRGTVRELEFSFRSRRLRCLVEIPGGPRLLLDPEDVLGAISTREVEAVEATPTAEGG